MSDYDDSDDGYDSEEEWVYMEDVFDEAVGHFKNAAYIYIVLT